MSNFEKTSPKNILAVAVAFASERSVCLLKISGYRATLERLSVLHVFVGTLDLMDLKIGFEVFTERTLGPHMFRDAHFGVNVSVFLLRGILLKQALHVKIFLGKK